MLKIALVIWIILGAALAGTAVLIVLAVPSLSLQAIKLLPMAAAAGFVVAVPFSLLIAKRIGRSTAQ